MIMEFDSAGVRELRDEISALRANNKLLRDAIADAQTRIHEAVEVLEEAWHRTR